MIPADTPAAENGTTSGDDADGASVEAVEPLVSAATLDDARREHDVATVSCRFRCASEGPFEGRWRGVRIRDLLASAPPETTHVRAWSADGYRVVVPLAEVLDAVLATERIDAPTDALPRLVGERLDSSETVQNVARLDAVSVPPGVDPEPTVLEEPPG